MFFVCVVILIVFYRYLMDDEKLIKDLDLDAFESEFKLNSTPIGQQNKDEIDNRKQSMVKAPKLDSLMEHTRLRNIAICKRKLPPNVRVQDIVRGINALDIQTLNIEIVELLHRMIPEEAEIKAYREYR